MKSGSFGSKEDAGAFCRAFFQWYNGEHKHAGIGYYTPEDVHYGRASKRAKLRNETLATAYARNPERFVHKKPVAPAVPTAVWINPPKSSEEPNMNSKICS